MSAKTYPKYYLVRKEYFEIWFDYLGAELTRKKRCLRRSKSMYNTRERLHII